MNRNHLDPIEQETIIVFNKKEKEAEIFTHDVSWQRHIEGKLGIKPVISPAAPRGTTAHGGKTYRLPKSMVKMPRAKKKLSVATKKSMAKRLSARRKQRTEKGSSPIIRRS